MATIGSEFLESFIFGIYYQFYATSKNILKELASLIDVRYQWADEDKQGPNPEQLLAERPAREDGPIWSTCSPLVCLV